MKTGGSQKSFLSLRAGPSAPGEEGVLRAGSRASKGLCFAVCQDAGPHGHRTNDMLRVHGGLLGPFLRMRQLTSVRGLPRHMFREHPKYPCSNKAFFVGIVGEMNSN